MKGNLMLKNKGFTLIEVLVVVAIIAILSSVIIIGLGPTRQAGRDARRISDLRSVQHALELYFNKCGAYPSSTEGCSGTTAITSWATLETAVSNVISTTTFPYDPLAGGTYYYAKSPSGNSYALGALLEDSNNPALKDSVGPGWTPITWSPTTPTHPNCNTRTATTTFYCSTL